MISFYLWVHTITVYLHQKSVKGKEGIKSEKQPSGKGQLLTWRSHQRASLWGSQAVLGFIHEDGDLFNERRVRTCVGNSISHLKATDGAGFVRVIAGENDL